MTPPAGRRAAAKTVRARPLVAAWKQAFQLATAKAASSGSSGCGTRGLSLHREGAVSQVHAVPGQFNATVAVKNGATRRARITVPQLDDDQWQHIADRLADDAAAVADILAGKVPASIAAAGHTGWPAIVPEAHEIRFFCTCLAKQKRSRLCDHSAALGHAVADRLTTSASALIAARGMTTRDLAEALRNRLTSDQPRVLTADASGSVRADHTYTLWANRTAGTPSQAGTPPHADVPSQAGTPPHADVPSHALPPLDRPEPLTLADPPPPAPRARDLVWLVQDAAARARTLLDDQAPPPPPHDGLADTVRLLASPHSIIRLPETAARAALTENELRRLLIAYRHGGPAGVDAATRPASVPPETLDEARKAIQRSTAALLGVVRITGDCLTDTTSGIQLRHGPDGHWYPFTEGKKQWRPAPGHSPDPVRAYRAARRARTARPAP